MLTPTPTAPPQPEHVVLRGISWDTYQAILREVGNRAIRMNYDDGALEIMSPLPIHERWKSFIGGLLELLALELDIPLAGLGSTTFFRGDLAKGLEPDECYYIQHEAVGRTLDRGDLTRQTPPDLAIEIDVTTSSVPRQRIYAALGVPELWRWNGRELRPMRLTDRGVYGPIEMSLAFPFLRVADLEPFLHRLGTESETTIRRDFQRWVRERCGGAGGPA